MAKPIRPSASHQGSGATSCQESEGANKASRILRICDACLEIHFRQMDSFARQNPEATADQWMRFFDKNQEWQLKRIREHCDPS